VDIPSLTASVALIPMATHILTLTLAASTVTSHGILIQPAPLTHS
jgi:hypothetical protein